MKFPEQLHNISPFHTAVRTTTNRSLGSTPDTQNLVWADTDYTLFLPLYNKVGQGTRSTGQGTNSANKLASTIFACMGSTLMMTMLAAISSATSPTCTTALTGQAA